MPSQWENIVKAAEALFEALENEKLHAFKNDLSTPDHSRDFYIALQELGKEVRIYRSYNKETKQ